MGVIIQKLRDSAKGQACAFALPGICNGDKETVVLCHCRIGYLGGASKPDDFSATAFGCFACHTAMDEHRVEDEAKVWLSAIQRTQRIWFVSGLMTFPTSEPRPRQLSKVVAHPGHLRR